VIDADVTQTSLSVLLVGVLLLLNCGQQSVDLLKSTSISRSRGKNVGHWLISLPPWSTIHYAIFIWRRNL